MLTMEAAVASAPPSLSSKQRLAAHKIDDYPVLKSVLPLQYKYRVLHYSQENEKGFQCYLRVHITTKAAALTWLECFQKTSKSTFRVDRTHPENTSRIVFKKEFRCYFQPDDLSARCTAKLTITIKKRTLTKSKDRFLLTHPCEIFLRHTHNHHTDAAVIYQDGIQIVPVKGQAVTEIRPSIIEVKGIPPRPQPIQPQPPPVLVEVKRIPPRPKPVEPQPPPVLVEIDDPTPTDKLTRTFVDLFRHGHSPSSALELHKFDLQQEHGDLYCHLVSERVDCPDYEWCRRLFFDEYKVNYFESKWFGKLLQTSVDSYNRARGLECARVVIDGTNVSLVLCSPLMRRIHAYLDSSSEVIFVDDPFKALHNYAIYVLLGHSCIGSLPLGVIMTSSESERVLTSAFKSYVSLLSERDAFHGNGRRQGPKVVMTSNDINERNGLVASFPNSAVLVCAFHVLDELKSYLWEAKNEIASEDRPHLFQLFKAIVNSESEAAVKLRFETANQDPIYQRYRKLQQCMNRLFDRRKEWLICCQENVSTKMLDTWTETASHELREKILNRAATFNPIQMFHFLSTRLESFYERKISSVVNNSAAISSGKLSTHQNLSDLICTRLCENLDNLYSVENVASEEKHVVDVILETCTCGAVSQGAPCKHQYAVVKQFGTSVGSLGLSLAADVEAKETLRQILSSGPIVTNFPGVVSVNSSHGSSLSVNRVISSKENSENNSSLPVIYCDISKCSTIEEFRNVLDNVMTKLSNQSDAIPSSFL